MNKYHSIRPYGWHGRPWGILTAKDMREDFKLRRAENLPLRWINLAGNLQ